MPEPERAPGAPTRTQAVTNAALLLLEVETYQPVEGDSLDPALHEDPELLARCRTLAVCSVMENLAVVLGPGAMRMARLSSYVLEDTREELKLEEYLEERIAREAPKLLNYAYRAYQDSYENLRDDANFQATIMLLGEGLKEEADRVFFQGRGEA